MAVSALHLSTCILRGCVDRSNVRSPALSIREDTVQALVANACIG
jgi:hypothetical protein